ncbi:MAG: c-type cytochrome [Bacteroidales bacterium]
MKKSNVLIVFTFTATVFLLMSFIIPQEQKQPAPWDIPDEYKNMENPYAGDKSLDRVGKILYSKHCKSCHGSNGECDGPKAKQLKTFCGDLTSQEFKAQSDGVIYYKSFIGRDEMPNFEKKIPEEEDKWAVVNYMRTFEK